MGPSVTMQLCWALIVTMMMSSVAGQDHPIPEIWKVVKDSYDSSVMVTMNALKPGVSMIVDEHYDITEHKGMLEILEHGHLMKINYYTETSQSFVLKGTQCSVGNLTHIPVYHFFGWDFTSGNTKEPLEDFIFGPSGLLKMVGDFQEQIEYIGEVTIRDILSERWTLTLDDRTIDYYFAIEAWQMPYGHKLEGVDLRAPVRVQVNGLEGNPWNPETPKFTQTVIYDYTDFQPFATPRDWKEFLVDSGIDCQGRQTLDPDETEPPEGLSHFKVFVETITNRTKHFPGIVFRSWMYFDTWRNLLRLDINSDYDMMEGVPRTSIMDRDSGVEYSINHYSGDCTIKTWSKGDFAKIVGAEIADVVMTASRYMFFLDEKYVFTGFSETRSMMTSRWTATRNDISKNQNPSKKHKKVVVDYQFLANTTEDAGEFTSSSIPVRIDLTIYDDKDLNSIVEVQTINLLNLLRVYELYELNPFDVRDCFDMPTQRSWFKISFHGKWNKGASQNQDLFKKEIIDQITDELEVSYVRLPEVEFDHDGNSVYATLLVLEPADYLLQFQPWEPAKPSIYDSKVQFRVNDDEVCAATCLTYRGFECRAFFECSGQEFNCYISNYLNSTGKKQPVPDCHHYKLSAESPRFQVPNAEVFKWLEKKIESGEFVFEFEYGALKNSKGRYEGYAIEDQAFEDDPAFVDYLRDDFRIARSHAFLTEDYTRLMLTTTYADCLLACDMTRGFKCETFSYCYKGQSCLLSDLVVKIPVKDKNIIQENDCVIISRRYLDEYNVIAGTVYVSDPKQRIERVNNDDRCAYLCDNTTDFTCRSFDYCYDSWTCDLYIERDIDIPEEKLNHSSPFCSHFERDTLVDFKKHPNQMLDGSRESSVVDVSVSHCADVCEKQPDYGCFGFDYCTDKTGVSTCFLTKDYYTDKGAVIHDSTTCNHFSREYYDGKDRNEFSHSKKSKYKYSPGDMAGLGVSMLVISIALTLAGIYVYNMQYK